MWLGNKIKSSRKSFLDEKDMLVTYHLNEQPGYVPLKLWIICIICLG